MNIHKIFINAIKQGYKFTASYEGEIEDGNIKSSRDLVNYANDESQISMTSPQGETTYFSFCYDACDIEEYIADYTQPNGVDHVKRLAHQCDDFKAGHPDPVFCDKCGFAHS